LPGIFELCVLVSDHGYMVWHCFDFDSGDHFSINSVHFTWFISGVLDMYCIYFA
jgi:hypothetical protein